MASDSAEIQNLQEVADQAAEHNQLDALRTLLLQKEQTRLHSLEQETAAFTETSQTQLTALQAEINTLQANLIQMQENADAQEARADGLQSQLDALRQTLQAESDALEPRLIQRMSSLLSQTIRNSRDEMAAALGPIMGSAIREQIRTSRKSMVEALFPIIIETVQRALAAFARELQQNIDARLKSTFRTDGWRRRIGARLRGVSASELAMRDALPFQIQEIFLIQRESGLLMAHVPIGDDGTADSDLVSGMLTAIRDFAQDSFGNEDDGQELDEFQYGDERVIIRSGRFAYLAVMIKGIEPSGFRTSLLEFVSELHLHYSTQFHEFDGNPATIPAGLHPQIAQLEMMVRKETDVSRPLTSGEKRLIWGGTLAGILLLMVGCFYLQFTIALWPVAFGDPTSTLSPTVTPVLPTATVVAAIPSTETAVSTATTTPIPTSNATPMPSNTPPPSATATQLPTATPLPPTATQFTTSTNAPSWIRTLPELDAATEVVIEAETAVRVLSQFGEWVEVEWQSDEGLKQGWIGIQWVNLSEPVPLDLITPLPNG